MTTTALVTVANGQLYRQFARQMLLSANSFFPKHIPFVWTDETSDFLSLPFTHYAFESDQRYRGYPNSTLYRYHEFLKAKDELEQFDQIFYADADMLFVSPVGDIFSDGITATLHPGYFEWRKHGEPECRKESTAFLEGNSVYYCGGFNGGTAREYLRMADTIRVRVDKDAENGLVARWHDESHLNRYLFVNHPKRVLSPSYCYPENYGGGYGWRPDRFPPILVALDKRGRRA